VRQKTSLVHLFARYFFRGLLIVAPAAVTVYVLWAALRWVDRLLDFEGRFGVRVPGLGALVVVLAVTLIGFVASTIVARYLIDLTDRIFTRLPFVRLMYSSIRDLIEAFVGEKKRFDRPVLVTIAPESDAKVLGFVTRERLEPLGVPGHVAVYLPQSYNFAGQLLVVPRERVAPIEADSTSVLAFILSAGVSAAQPRTPAGA